MNELQTIINRETSWRSMTYRFHGGGRNFHRESGESQFRKNCGGCKASREEAERKGGQGATTSRRVSRNEKRRLPALRGGAPRKQTFLNDDDALISGSLGNIAHRRAWPYERRSARPRRSSPPGALPILTEFIGCEHSSISADASASAESSATRRAVFSGLFVRSTAV